VYPPPYQAEYEVYELFWIAKEVGVPVWELAKQPAYILEGYRAMMWIDNRVKAEYTRKAQNVKHN